MWDQRYSVEEYVYGTEGNDFFREELKKIPTGRVLLPGEGEGRNAVFAAQLGWKVCAFDPSVEGRKKALKLADRLNVKIQYDIYSYKDYQYEPASFDAIGLFYTHQPPEMRIQFHRSLKKMLKPGGVVILEMFSKEQIQRDTGGPKNIDFLNNEQELRMDFSYLEELEISEQFRVLNEGPLHQGEAAVVRLVGKL